MKDTTVNKITSFVRKEIMYGRLKGGDHITETKVAKSFKISRVPVRESFRILHSEGYLEMIPNRGSFVRKISADYLKEIYKVYVFIAPELLRDAIPRYKKTDFKKINSVISRIEKCKNFNKIGYLLWDFAQAIYGPSENKFMLCVMNEIYKHNIRILNDLFELKKKKNYDLTAHKQFLELCLQNKTEEAVKIWINHINKLADNYPELKIKKQKSI